LNPPPFTLNKPTEEKKLIAFKGFGQKVSEAPQIGFNVPQNPPEEKKEEPKPTVSNPAPFSLGGGLG